MARRNASKSGNEGPRTRLPVQVDAALDKPLDADAPPTIYGTSLKKPEFATAALNLSIDFIKQQQSQANKYMLFHPVTLFLIFLCLLTYLTTHVVIPRQITSKSATGFLVQFILMNKRTLGSAALMVVVSASFIFTLLSRITDAYFKSKIDEVNNEKGANIFGINLSDLVKNGSDSVNKRQLDNTHIVVYRETPISLVSITQNEILSTKESATMTISSLGCRRVYLKSGILEDLLDWAMVRTRTVCRENKFNGKSMKLLMNVYSFDGPLRETLKNKGFTKVQSIRLPENRLLGGLFGVKSELWGIQFRFEPTKSGKK